MLNLYKDPIVDTTQYGYVYRTTNLLNGKTYIGKHRIKNGEKWRSYMGSGRIITNSLKKYGKNNFKKELLSYASSLDKLNAVEKEYIIKEVSAGKGEYNLDSNENGTKVRLKDLNINDDEILSWYFDDKMSWLEIEVKLGVSPTTVYRYMMKKYKGSDPRFDNIQHGLDRSGRNKKQLELIGSLGVQAAQQKKECQYCGRSCSITVLNRHEIACEMNSNGSGFYPNCSEPNCNKRLQKKTAKYCREHFNKNINNIETHYSLTTNDLKLGGKVSTHNRHHIQKEFYTEFCDLCIDYCSTNHIKLTVVKEDIRELLDLGMTNIEIGKLYGVGKSTVYGWRKRLNN